MARMDPTDLILGYVDVGVIGLKGFFAQGTVVCLGTFSLWPFLFNIFVRSLGTGRNGVLSFGPLVASDITLVSKQSVCKDIFIHSFILLLLLLLLIPCLPRAAPYPNVQRYVLATRKLPVARQFCVWRPANSQRLFTTTVGILAQLHGAAVHGDLC